MVAWVYRGVAAKTSGAARKLWCKRLAGGTAGRPENAKKKNDKKGIRRHVRIENDRVRISEESATVRSGLAGVGNCTSREICSIMRRFR